MKAKEPKKFVNVCPKCGSTDFVLTNLVGAIGSNFLKCRECGYEGTFVEVEEKNINKFKKLMKK